MNLRRTYPSADETGTIMLQSAPDCVEPYNGAFRKVTVFVVGYGTDQETLFKRADRTPAIKFAKENRLTFDQVIAGQLCDTAAIALLEPTSV